MFFITIFFLFCQFEFGQVNWPVFLFFLAKGRARQPKPSSPHQTKVRCRWEWLRVMWPVCVKSAPALIDMKGSKHLRLVTNEEHMTVICRRRKWPIAPHLQLLTNTVVTITANHWHTVCFRPGRRSGRVGLTKIQTCCQVLPAGLFRPLWLSRGECRPLQPVRHCSYQCSTTTDYSFKINPITSITTVSYIINY